MKTAMQQFIETTDEAIKANNTNSIEVALVLQAVKFKAEKLLEAEKEQIMESFNAGHLDGYESGKYNEEEIYAGCDDYFNKTFKSEQ